MQYRALLSAQKKATKQAPRTKDEAWADAQASCDDGSSDEDESDGCSDDPVGLEFLDEDEMDTGVIRSQDPASDSVAAAALADAVGSAEAVAQAKSKGMYALGKRKRGGTDFRTLPTETVALDDSDGEERQQSPLVAAGPLGQSAADAGADMAEGAGSPLTDLSCAQSP
jgi:hypothetical protein